MKLPKDKIILHTSPHHDDILLGYYPFLKYCIENNQNAFACITSGHRSVMNDYLFTTLNCMQEREILLHKHDIFEKPEMDLLEDFVQAFYQNNRNEMRKIEIIQCLRNFCHVYQLYNLEELFIKKRELNDKDLLMPILKGSIRETEEERMLAILGIYDSIYHLRAQFYDQLERLPQDVSGLLKLIKEIRPEVITVLIDPKEKGPSTHYHTLQLIVKSLQLTEEHYQPEIWGYRNVWSQFEPQEANFYMLASKKDLLQMDKIFTESYSTQSVAAYPHPNFKGRFSELAQKIQEEQYKKLFPLENQVQGLIFMKTFSKREFINSYISD